jgi:AraC-like DNA-binding protein
LRVVIILTHIIGITPESVNGYLVGVSRETDELNRRLLRARDAMDRAYAEPLNVAAVAAVAHMSEAHFSRTFRQVFGETPHRYLQRRRVERSMFALRETDRDVTDICMDVGFSSLGTFSRTFREIVGVPPSQYRADNGPMLAPGCIQMMAMRPLGASRAATAPSPSPSQVSSFGEASEDVAAVA